MAERLKTDYFLTTSRLGFRYWNRADLNLAISLWGNLSVTDLIGGPFSADQISCRLHEEIETQERWGIQYWPVFTLFDGAFAGCCGLRPYKDEQEIREIGVHLLPEWSGKGIATEALRSVISYAFMDLRLKALFAGHNPENETSKHLLIKLGFKYTHDEYYEPTGLMHPSYLLTAVDFQRIR